MSTNDKIVVWSKNNCPACTMVKNALKLKSIEFEERNIEEEFTVRDLHAVLPSARTVPQVFINSKYLGGVTEVMAYLNHDNT